MRAHLLKNVLPVGMDVEPSIHDCFRHYWGHLSSLLLESNGEVISHQALLTENSCLDIHPHYWVGDIGYLQSKIYMSKEVAGLQSLGADHNFR